MSALSVLIIVLKVFQEEFSLSSLPLSSVALWELPFFLSSRLPLYFLLVTVNVE